MDIQPHCLWGILPRYQFQRLLASARPAEPQRYDPVTKRLTESISTDKIVSVEYAWRCLGCHSNTHIKALIVPCAPGPFDAADKALKTKTMRVHAIMPHCPWSATSSKREMGRNGVTHLPSDLVTDPAES